ncbi:MAG: hypothetical protein ACLGIR_06310 [Actinomycetes bacterium]
MATQMSDEHKAALAKGRAQAKAVRDYLEELEKQSKPGRRVSKEELEGRLEETIRQIEQEDDPAKRVELIQKRIDLEDRLADAAEEVDMEALERGFVEAVAEYSERKGISYSAWRELGVPAAALREGGVPRTRRG